MLRVSVVETLLIFVGVPALGFAVLAVLVYAGGARRAPRYRPGRGWNHDDVWYLPRPAPGNSHSAAALTAGDTPAAGALRPASGGASGTW